MVRRTHSARTDQESKKAVSKSNETTESASPVKSIVHNEVRLSRAIQSWAVVRDGELVGSRKRVQGASERSHAFFRQSEWTI